MRYVLDASVGFKWAIIEADTPKARRLRNDYISGVHSLVAPDFFPVEIAHSLTRAERQRRITPAEGLRALLDISQTLPLLVPSLPLLRRAYTISSQNRVGAYDCVYVALADWRGEFALLLPEPNPLLPPAGVSVTSPNTSGRQTITQLRWPVTLRFFYQPQGQLFITTDERGRVGAEHAPAGAHRSPAVARGHPMG